MLRNLKIFITILILFPGIALSRENSNTEKLFDEHKDRLYQIRIIEKTSGEAISFGSGFQIADNGLIATNYHVISQLIHKPDDYHAECRDKDENIYPVKLLDIDIVNDLAIISFEEQGRPFFNFNPDDLNMGERVFAIGNPYDLNMSIVEGIYNGFLEKQLHEKILFSGALNPGMSGGPAIDVNGNVVGINVSTAGNSIGFLVPVKFLSGLLQKVLASEVEPEIDFQQRIESQLLNNQKKFMSEILESDWDIELYGEVNIPKIKLPFIDGWGKKGFEKKEKYIHNSSGYYFRDSIYVTHIFSTGTMKIRYDWFETEELNNLQFYNVVEKTFNMYFSPNTASKKNRTSYITRVSFLKHHNMNWKTAIGIRQYIHYPGIYDFTLNMVSLGHDDKAMVIQLALAGVSKKNGNLFIRKFIEAVKWQN